MEDPSPAPCPADILPALLLVISQEGCGQWLHVQVEAVTSGVPRSSILGQVLFNFFFNIMHELSGVVDATEGRDPERPGQA